MPNQNSVERPDLKKLCHKKPVVLVTYLDKITELYHCSELNPFLPVIYSSLNKYFLSNTSLV